MRDRLDIDGYRYGDASHSAAHSYLLPLIRQELDRLKAVQSDMRLFDLGCGNGRIAAALSDDGRDVTGVDASDEGISQARNAYPRIKFEQGSAYEDLASRFGQFPIVISLEVVEHVYAPRDYAKTLCDLLLPGGIAIVSTPYHGYVKNLAIALAGKMDQYFTALWDHGHIKFWSIQTLSTLLGEAGFRELRFIRAGRVPPLAKSMIAVARKD